MTAPVTPPSPTDPTSLNPGNYGAPAILNRIFKLILSMISSLQNVAAAQAARLTFMSNWQKAYTDTMKEVPTFIAGQGSFPNMSDDKRGDFNRLNSNLIATLQNRQSVVSDDAKALQSNVNQSNDAVNQQSNLGTAILQELNTLLGAIFK